MAEVEFKFWDGPRHTSVGNAVVDWKGACDLFLDFLKGAGYNVSLQDVACHLWTRSEEVTTSDWFPGDELDNLDNITISTDYE